MMNLKYYLYVQVLKKKPGMKMVTKKKELLVNLVRKNDEQKHFGNVGAHGCLQLKFLQDQ